MTRTFAYGYAVLALALCTLLLNILPSKIQLETETKELVTPPLPIAKTQAYHDCSTFGFARTEWTYYWKSEFDAMKESETCREVHSKIFKEKSVKWIVYPNKTIQNLGCTKHTPACRPSAHYDHKFEVRINMPPCCRRKLLSIWKTITEGFQRLRIPHVLCGGAVIGWIRYGGIIPYDYDLDVLVDADHWRTPKFLKFLEETQEKYGYKYAWRKSDMQSLSIDFSETNDNGIGFWTMRRLPNGMVRIPNNKNKDQPQENIYPPKMVNFSGLTTFVPNNPERFCDNRYGVGKWQKEIKCTKLSGRKCTG